MKIRYWFTVCLCLLSLSGLSSNAQTRKPVTPKAQFATAPFDLEAKQLPPRYLGHSLLDIWGPMNDRKKLMQKGEYETTNAWQARTTKLNASMLTGTLTPSSLLAFKLSGSETSYSADDQALTIVAPKSDEAIFDSINDRGLSDFDSFLWRFDNKRAGSFIGSNAFGVKRRVQVEQETSYFLVLKTGQIGEARMLTIQDVKPDQAKVIRPLLSVLLVGNLIDPHVGGDKQVFDATIDDPLKTSTYKFFTYIKPTAFWFYNYETGEVYYRADLIPKEKAQAKK